MALNATCDVNVVFSPTAAGVFAGTLTVATNASNGSNKIASFSGSTTSPGTIGFSSEEYSFNNDVETAVIYVTRTDGSSGSASVNYTTQAGTASEAAGDYEATSGTLTWANGDYSPKSINITINDLSFDDESRNFSIILSPTTGNATLGTNVAAVTLYDHRKSISLSTDGEVTTSATTDTSGCTSNGSSSALLVVLSGFMIALALKRKKQTQQ